MFKKACTRLKVFNRYVFSLSDTALTLNGVALSPRCRTVILAPAPPCQHLALSGTPSETAYKLTVEAYELNTRQRNYVRFLARHQFTIVTSSE